MPVDPVSICVGAPGIAARYLEASNFCIGGFGNRKTAEIAGYLFCEKAQDFSTLIVNAKKGSVPTKPLGSK